MMLLCSLHVYCWGSCHLPPGIPDSHIFEAVRVYLLLPYLSTVCCQKVSPRGFGERTRTWFFVQAFKLFRTVHCRVGVLGKCRLCNVISGGGKAGRKILCILCVLSTNTSCKMMEYESSNQQSTPKWYAGSAHVFLPVLSQWEPHRYMCDTPCGDWQLLAAGSKML